MYKYIFVYFLSGKWLQEKKNRFLDFVKERPHATYRTALLLDRHGGQKCIHCLEGTLPAPVPPLRPGS